MRPDQRERLADLSERLAEQAINDADPDNWTGSGKLPQDLTQEERGDAVWCRKLALSTLAVLSSVARLQVEAPAKPPGGPQPEDAAAVDAEIAAAEREARRLLDRVVVGVQGAKRDRAKH